MPGPTEADTCRDRIVPALVDAGWQDHFEEQVPITDGRIMPTRHGHRRSDRRLRADYVLQRSPGLNLAVVEAKREYATAGDGLQQAKRYAERLDVPFAYASNGEDIIEHDFDTGLDRQVTTFPTPDDLWQRYRAWQGLEVNDVAEDVARPFNRTLRNPDGQVREPRYYQAVAINRAVAAIRSGRPRTLLTMATGTGKTFVAMQVVWKLWNSAWVDGRRPRILYLADRNILIDQPIASNFRPVFGDAVWKIQGTRQTGREVYFALYQALADTGDAMGLFRDYPQDYFDLVIVDECHRGSATEGSTWRTVLDHFSPAAQLGMTATPLREDNRDTYDYFGAPMFTYSLAQGIEDGFLAPYRVRRVVLSPDADGWAPSQGQLDRYGREIPPGLYTSRDFERVVSLLARTEAAARHLGDHLERTDPLGKTIVFCVDSEHAEQMRMALNNATAEHSRRHADHVVRIVSDEGAVGEAHLGQFQDPQTDTPVIATTSRMLSTGVDMPTVRTIVLFKPIGSMVEFKQIIGRGTRLYPDAGKLSFEIIDYSGATALFEDPDFDGPPEGVTVEEVDGDGQLVEVPEVAAPDPGFDEPAAAEDDLVPRARRKFYVDDGTAFVTAEGVYLPDPGTNQLRLVAYHDHVADTVRSLYPDASELRERWRSGPSRGEVRTALLERGIELAEVAEQLEMSGVDPVDLLVHLAWNEPLTSRRDRVRRAQERLDAVYDELKPAARAVLDELLDKYAEHGIEQLEDLRVLRVPPLREHGTVHEIAALFGGEDRLRGLMRVVEVELYAA